MAIALPDVRAPRGVQEWLERELQQERLAALQLLETRHRVLIQSLDAAHKNAGAAPKAAEVVDVEVGMVNESQLATSSKPAAPKKEKSSFLSLATSASKPRQGKKLEPSRDEQERNAMFVRPQSIRQAVDNPLFEIVFTILIIVAGILTAVQLQYESFDAAHMLNFTVPTPKGSVIPEKSEDTWPWAGGLLRFTNYFFGVIFIIEIVLKMIAYELHFACSAWNLFDLGVVISWVYDELKAGSLIVNPMIMRLARLARILRLFRVMKSLQGLDGLKLIVTSIQGSARILMASLFVLIMQMMLVGLIFAFMLQVDLQNEHLDPEKRRQIFKYFGSFTRTMLTMFEVTVGNWVPVTRMLADTIGQHWALILVTYNILVGFAVMQVIRGVFMRETFKVAATDDDLMVIDTEAKKQNFANKMKALVARADSSGDGNLTKEDFEAVVCDTYTKHWLGAMELSIPNTDRVWNLLDDGDGNVDAAELIAGFGRFKGPAKALDLLFVSNEVKDLQKSLKDLRAELTVSLQNLAQAARTPTTAAAQDAEPEGNRYQLAVEQSLAKAPARWRQMISEHRPRRRTSPRRGYDENSPRSPPYDFKPRLSPRAPGYYSNGSAGASGPTAYENYGYYPYSREARGPMQQLEQTASAPHLRQH